MEGNLYSGIRTVMLERFKVARYVVISPSSEEMVIPCMERWTQQSGLLDCPAYRPQTNRLGFPVFNLPKAFQVLFKFAKAAS